MKTSVAVTLGIAVGVCGMMICHKEGSVLATVSQNSASKPYTPCFSDWVLVDLSRQLQNTYTCATVLVSPIMMEDKAFKVRVLCIYDEDNGKAVRASVERHRDRILPALISRWRGEGFVIEEKDVVYEFATRQAYGATTCASTPSTSASIPAGRDSQASLRLYSPNFADWVYVYLSAALKGTYRHGTISVMPREPRGREVRIKIQCYYEDSDAGRKFKRLIEEHRDRMLPKLLEAWRSQGRVVDASDFTYEFAMEE